MKIRFPRFLIPGKRFFVWIGSAVALYAVIGFVAVRTAAFPEVRDGSPFVVEHDASGENGADGGGDPTTPTPGVETPARTVVVRGAVSVHTGRSHDAEGTFSEVAAAAADADLHFVVAGDHPGDWVLPGPEVMAPFHEEDVLIVPGLEMVVSNIGRTLAVGLDTFPQHWEEGIPALVERVDRLEGFLSVVHPRSPKARERWDGLESPGIHAWESFDISEMARARFAEPGLAPYRAVSFLGALLTGGGQGALKLLWKEGTGTPALLAFDSVRADRYVVMTGGLNHHPKARIGPVLFPRYQPFFRTVVNHVSVDGGVGGDPLEARGRLLAALRRGSLFVTLGSAGDAEGFTFAGFVPAGASVPAAASVPMGGQQAWSEGAALEITLPARGARRLLVRVLRDGQDAHWLAVRRGDHLSIPAAEPGVYRVEVFSSGIPLGGRRFNARPWIISNPVEFYGATRLAAAN